MSPALETVLAEAYDIVESRHDMEAACQVIERALANATLRAEAVTEQGRMSQVFAARGTGDHINAVLLNLLNTVLGDPVAAQIPSEMGGFAFVADGVGGLSIKSPDGSLYPLVVPK